MIAKFSARGSALYLIRATGLVIDVGALAAAAKLMSMNIWLPPLVGFPIYLTCLPILLLVPGMQENGYNKINEKEEKVVEENELNSNASETSNQMDLASQVTNSRILHETNSAKTLIGRSKIYMRETFSTCHELMVGNPISQACLVIYFLDSFATDVRSIVPQWASKNLGWTIAETNYLLSFRSFISGIVLVLLPLHNRVLRHRGISSPRIDLGITSFSMIALLVGSVTYGFSWSKLTFIMALAISSLGSGFHDSLKSYCTAKVPRHQVTQLYIGIATAARVGNLIGGPIWAGLFVVSMNAGTKLSGLPFWMSTILWGVVGYLLWGLRTKSAKTTRNQVT